MNPLLANLVSANCFEYLIFNQDYQILEASSGVHEFVDNSESINLGDDIRLPFPELVGIEEILVEILQGEQKNFNLKGVKRCLDEDSPLYMDLYIIKNVQVDSSHHTTSEFIMIVVNSTERMVMEQSMMQSINNANFLLRNLTASKQYIDQIVTSMADGLLVTTLSGKIKKINLTTTKILEYSEEELLGQNIEEIIRDIHQLTLDNVAGEGNFSQTIKEIEISCTTKSGKNIPLAISCSVVQTEIEHFQGYVYILRDMTERKQAELAKQEFLAMISHEIRTPIASVTGMASLLLNTKLTAEQRNFTNTIYLSGEALHKIINDILDFSKSEAGKLELEAEPFELRRCINEAIMLVAPKAQEKGLSLNFLDNSAIPTIIIGDIVRLRQILVNLLANAIKFTDHGSVEVSFTGSKIANYNHHPEGIKPHTYELQFAVKDTGIGIDKNHFDRLFKVFSQVNSSITRQYGGTGLGLAICKQLCELMGGRIWAESEPGLGSTFHFTIVVDVVSETREHTIHKTSESSGEIAVSHISHHVQIDTTLAQKHPLKILLVEDNLINQKMIQIMLQRMGYNAEIANNGLEALAALRRQLYDVVFMDLQMPKMDGLTAVKQICEEWTPDKRPWIIALTANALPEERDRCLQLGMNDYLVKPIRIAELMETIKRCHPIVCDRS
ncbi:signal transduction histidine-protein kinase [Richelia sinica FACHB-800]|uniref:Circadian input-output histidine kinase CikA n=1 Tax=Richelia sinica FACHB-800 TaxID=1357546 RepID=A0A975T5Z3_9NOST|nr:ATP-binding protein [Richelia sinica]MBD2663200.1 response regulator [Richelia sinica FACHB-800]QXE22082.1 signal transduction histidine-protein kinase [Richelia sinica FACHB-800]